MKSTSTHRSRFLKMLASILFVMFSSWIFHQSLFAQAETKIRSNDRLASDFFGSSVSLNGDYALIGAPGKNLRTGVAYIFHHAGPNQWAQSARLSAYDGFRNNEFGGSVSLMGDYALVGASQKDLRIGKVYVFHFEIDQWKDWPSLLWGDQPYEFGNSVSRSGNYIIVGAPFSNFTGLRHGAAHIYHFEGDRNYSHMVELSASDGADNDFFGYSVSLSGSYALVGAAGAGTAYIYHFNGTEWLPAMKLNASNGVRPFIGMISVSLSNDYAFVGLPDMEMVNVYHRAQNVWESSPQVVLRNGAGSDLFGFSVDQSGDYAVIGAPGDNNKGFSSGAVYIYHHDSNGWQLVRKLTASDGDIGDSFGQAVSLRGNYLLVGAPSDESEGPDYSGSAYIYELPHLSVNQSLIVFDQNEIEKQLQLDNHVFPGIEIPWRTISDQSWLTLSPLSGVIAPGQVTAIKVRVDHSALDAGYYQGQIFVDSDFGRDTVAVSIFESKKFGDYAAPFALSPGEQSANYRIISIPGILDDPKPAFLEKALGTKDIKKWRFFDTNAAGTVASVEYPDTRDWSRGRGFFLIVRDKDKTIHVPNVTLPGDTSFTYRLNKGWNLIGTPFSKDLALDGKQVTLVSDDSRDALRLLKYENGVWPDTQVMRPWQGYAIAVNGNASLVYTPYRGSTGTNLKKSVWSTNAEDWRIQISARTEFANDTLNYAGVSESALLARDQLDAFEPPVIGDYISLSFPHPEWNTFQADFTADYRPPFGQGEDWELVVRSNQSDVASLNFSNLAAIPANLKVVLVDPASGITTDLRKSIHYEFALQAGERGKLFRLLIGTQEYLQHNSAFSSRLPAEMSLLQNYPNPFNPATTIVFELPTEQVVTIKVLNVLGQEVKTLAEHRIYPAGRHAVVWDGRNVSGERVGSGVYFYRFEAGQTKQIRKMVLLP